MTPRARSRRPRSPGRCCARSNSTRARSPTRSRSSGLLNVQYAVKDGKVFVIEANPRASRTVPFVSKATGVPLAKIAARAMVGATFDELRAEGPAAPAGRRWSRLGEGSGAAVQPVPRRRHGARAGDALDRRGHGHRPHVRHGVRQEPVGRRQHAAPPGHGVPLARRPRQGQRARRRAPVRASSASRSRRPPAPPTCSSAPGSPSTRSWPRSGSRSGSTRSISSRRARSISWSTRPAAGVPRTDGMHIRRAAIAHGVACVTTVAAALAAAAGHRRGVAPRARGALAPGVPPRRSAEARAVRRGRSPGRRSPRRSGGPVDRPIDLAVDLGPVRLPNPMVAASGTFGHGAEVANLCDPHGLGAVTVKSVAAFAWSGNPPLRVTEAPGGGMLNSVGLPGPGVDAWIEHDLPALEARGARVIASIWGRSAEEYASAARALKAVAHRLGRARGQSLVSQRRGARQRVRALRGRDARRDARGRRVDRRHRCRRSPSSRPTSPTSSRSRARRSTRARPDSRWSTR